MPFWDIGVNSLNLKSIFHFLDPYLWVLMEKMGEHIFMKSLRNTSHDTSDN